MAEQLQIDAETGFNDFRTPNIIENKYKEYLTTLHIFCKIRNYNSIENKEHANKKREDIKLIKDAKKLISLIKTSSDEELRNSLIKKFFGSIDNEPYAETLLYDGTKEQCPVEKGSPDEYANFLQNVVRVKDQTVTINVDGLEEGEYSDSDIQDICSKYIREKHYYSYFDTFHKRILREPQVMESFIKLAKYSITTGDIPIEFLQSWTYKVPKSEKYKTSPDNNNYRPLVTFDFKSILLQRIVLELLIKETKDKVKGLQFAYREHYGRELHILALHQHIKKLKHGKRNYAVLFYDVAKAFNNVNHERLLKKLKKLEINKGLFNWLKTFLTTQETRVRISKAMSEPFVPHGIPQGSPISPWLFVLYMNDLFDLFVDDDYVKIFLYADDMSVVICDPNEEKINTVHKKLQDWLQNDALMEVNKNKSNYYLRTFDDTKNKHMDTKFGKLQFNNLFQPNSEIVGYAGLQELLQAESHGYDRHVDKLIAKIDRFIHAFQAVKQIFPYDKNIYKMFIESTEFDSQILLWGIDLINREKVQKSMDNILLEYGEVFCDPNLPKDETLQMLREEFKFDVEFLYRRKTQYIINMINNHLQNNETLVKILDDPVSDSALERAIIYLENNLN